ncbi:MAG: Bug family tripartite tricarboxylate transporter substrate binding protein [Pseudomonadota bacterium]
MGSKGMRGFVAAALGIVAMVTTSNFVQAQTNYPEKRITFVVPYPPGGATDVTARMLAQKLSEAWKQPVIVENKPGAGGIVGNDFVAKAAPDGYTVLVAITQIIQAPSLNANLPYDVAKDLAPIAQVCLSTISLVVPEQQPFKTLKEYIDFVKANPGKPYGSFGNATTSHLYGELLKKAAGFDMTHVPYRGSAPMLNDLLGNQVMGAFIDLTTGMPQIKAGKIRPLAVGGEKRNPFLPNVPTMAESGFPGFEAEGWVGLFVPAATPKPIIDKLSAELAKIIASPEGVEKIQSFSMVPVGGGAEVFAKALKTDQQRWADVVKATGVKAE